MRAVSYWVSEVTVNNDRDLVNLDVSVNIRDVVNLRKLNAVAPYVSSCRTLFLCAPSIILFHKTSTRELVCAKMDPHVRKVGISSFPSPSLK